MVSERNGENEMVRSLATVVSDAVDKSWTKEFVMQNSRKNLLNKMLRSFPN